MKYNRLVSLVFASVFSIACQRTGGISEGGETDTDSDYGHNGDTTTFTDDGDSGGSGTGSDSNTATESKIEDTTTPDTVSGVDTLTDFSNDTESANDSGEDSGLDTIDVADTLTDVDSADQQDSETETDSGSSVEFETDSGVETDSATNPGTDADSETVADTDSQRNDTEDTSPTGPRANQPKALVVIIDNSQSMEGGDVDALYQQFPNEIGGIFADMYEQPIEEIQSRTMTEIAEDFGEDWIIADVESVAEGHYDDITSLTDSDATLNRFLSAIADYTDAGYQVDILIDLHGTTDGDLLFYDDRYNVSDVTAEIAARELNVSVVYQTVCYGSEMTDAWAEIGIHAVNGAVGENMYVNFAPGAFLAHWIDGDNYDDAVQQARIDDMTEMQERLTDAATGNMMMRLMIQMYDFESQSPQTVDGLYPDILWL
ncbi:MAG: hypothetical protein JXX14_05965 [Deltaproteobacteria bacterium]|nr:hypothetical protein [Deltaproteobacteria bacterium]